jgi:Protein of unknown function (DUF1376)/DnaB-like helicase C terminal domain
MSSPAFQFYPADYLADANVQMMTLEEEGAYIRLLSYCWREGTIPADNASLSRLCKGASDEEINVFLRPELKPGLSVPFSTIHVTLSGLRRSKLIIVAARPGVGKTALAF